MARARNLRLWGIALWAVCLLAPATVHLGAATATQATEAPAAVGLASHASDTAILPARAAGEVRAAGQTAPLRVVVLAAVLALLVGLPAALRRRDDAAGHDSEPLRTRRHTIALRAPPLQFA